MRAASFRKCVYIYIYIYLEPLHDPYFCRSTSQKTEAFSKIQTRGPWVQLPRQWQVDPKAVEPVTEYKNADTVFQVKPFPKRPRSDGFCLRKTPNVFWGWKGCQLAVHFVDVYGIYYIIYICHDYWGTYFPLSLVFCLTETPHKWAKIGCSMMLLCIYK